MVIQKLELNDPRWATLESGYGTPIDDIAILDSIFSKDATLGIALKTLGPELNNQGQIGNLEIAIFPWLVESFITDGNWNFLAASVILDLAHCQQTCPEASADLLSYFNLALNEFYEHVKKFRGNLVSTADKLLLDAVDLHATGQHDKSIATLESSVMSCE